MTAVLYTYLHIALFCKHKTIERRIWQKYRDFQSYTKIMTVCINMFVKSFQSRHSTCLCGRTQLLQSTTYTPILYIAHCRIDVYSALQSEKKHLGSNYGNIYTRVSET